MISTEPTPLFSIIVPTHGRPALLAEALASVLVQTVGDFEVLVVDDASSERVGVPADPRFRLIRREQNGGVAAARNLGLLEARGKYVAFLDDDDAYTPDRLAVGLEGLARAPISICQMAYLGEDTSTRDRRRLLKRENRPLDGDVYDTIVERTRPHLGQVSLQRRVAPLFDERFQVTSDVEWWIRVTGGVPVTAVPRAGYLFRRHSSERLTDRLGARLRANQILLEVQAEYFGAHPKAEAVRWRHMGMIAGWLGDRAEARKAFARSMSLDPRLVTVLQTIRSQLPTGGRSGRSAAEEA